MKKLLVVLIVLVLLGLALPVSNLIIKMPPNALTSLKTDDALFAKVLPVLGEKCANCHSAEYFLPFYAKFPLAKGIIEGDVTRGLRWFDMFEGLMATPVSEVALAKIEHSVAHNTMPPTPYLMLHWNHAVSSAERADILEWVKETRAKHYVTQGVADVLANNPVQPIPRNLTFDERKVALGDKLFHDKRLSGDDTVSCASCHALDKGGTDQAQFATGIGGQMGDINSPTCFNALFQFKQFWDGRAADLVEQADGPVNNPIEMGSNWTQAVGKLTQDAAFMQEFLAVYPAGPSKETCIDAIAEFERTLNTPNSAVDKYLYGDEAALTAQEKHGFDLFNSAGCAMCHVGKAMGGQSFELMGLARDYFADRGSVKKPDNGRFNVTNDEKDRHRFKVPILRNIALTFPYFHDGSTSDLNEAVDVMAKYQLGLDLPDADLAALTAFLKATTGEYKGVTL